MHNRRNRFERVSTVCRRAVLWRLLALILGLTLVFSLSGPRHVFAAVDCTDTATTGVTQADCEALVALYNSTNGPGWDTSTNWNTPSLVRNWHGVTVVGANVTEISLANNNLNGPVPDLSALVYLTRLDLSNNYLTGSLPSFSALIHLEYFRLEHNQLTGSVPNLSALTSLLEFNLAEN